MTKNTTHQQEAKNTKLANKDIVIGQGIIKAIDDDRSGTVWALPGRTTTRSKICAEKCASIINKLIVEGQAA